jgi:hypothetical protein
MRAKLTLAELRDWMLGCNSRKDAAMFGEDEIDKRELLLR